MMTAAKDSEYALKYSCSGRNRSYIACSPHQVREEGGRGLSGFFVARTFDVGRLLISTKCQPLIN